jgi:hypothetical protein
VNQQPTCVLVHPIQYASKGYWVVSVWVEKWQLDYPQWAVGELEPNGKVFLVHLASIPSWCDAGHYMFEMITKVI